jgi:hypothetical protein
MKRFIILILIMSVLTLVSGCNQRKVIANNMQIIGLKSETTGLCFFALYTGGNEPVSADCVPCDSLKHVNITYTIR